MPCKKFCLTLTCPRRRAAAMSAPQKLTKKQKKGIAFRDRKVSKSRSHGGPAGLEDNEVPVLEVQDLADDEVDSPALEGGTKQGVLVDPKGKEKGKESRKGKEKAKDSGGVPSSPAQKKRKRDDAAVDSEAVATEGQDEKVDGPKRKKAKGTGESAKEGKAQVKQRFILFVGKLKLLLSTFIPHCYAGNLKYTTTAEAIKAHFAACGMLQQYWFSIVMNFPPRSSTNGSPSNAKAVRVRKAREQIQRLRICGVHSPQRPATRT